MPKSTKKTTKKTRPSKYSKPLVVNASFDDILKASIPTKPKRKRLSQKEKLQRLKIVVNETIKASSNKK